MRHYEAFIIVTEALTCKQNVNVVFSPGGATLNYFISTVEKCN